MTGSGVRVRVTTFGCKANLADSAALADAITAELGVPVTAGHDVSGADVLVLNTCTVTQAAAADARKAIRHAHRENPKVRIIVTGCYAQTDRDALAGMDEVTEVVGNIDKADLPGVVARVVRGEPASPARRDGHRLWNPTLRDAAAIRALPEGLDRPFVKVQDGCDYACSFCIIPTARGASRSRTLEEVTAEVRRYEALGAQEIVLTGIHLGHWGRDLEPRRRFGHMLEALLEATSHARLRVSSLEPNEVDDHVLDLVTSHPRVCRHLHVPLQSADDGVLARMARVYRARHYARAVERFRARSPRGAWGADVMVGFPSEDDAAFGETRRFVEAHGLSYLHVFPFSPRRGTPAASMRPGVHPERARARATELNAVSAELRRAHVARSIGHVGTVLVETGVGPDGARIGYTECYVQVRFDASLVKAGSLVPVRLMRADGTYARSVMALDSGDQGVFHGTT